MGEARCRALTQHRIWKIVSCFRVEMGEARCRALTPPLFQLLQFVTLRRNE